MGIILSLAEAVPPGCTDGLVFPLISPRVGALLWNPAPLPQGWDLVPYVLLASSKVQPPTGTSFLMLVGIPHLPTPALCTKKTYSPYFLHLAACPQPKAPAHHTAISLLKAGDSLTCVPLGKAQYSKGS